MPLLEGEYRRSEECRRPGQGAGKRTASENKRGEAGEGPR